VLSPLASPFLEGAAAVGISDVIYLTFLHSAGPSTLPATLARYCAVFDAFFQRLRQLEDLRGIFFFVFPTPSGGHEELTVGAEGSIVHCRCFVPSATQAESGGPPSFNLVRLLKILCNSQLFVLDPLAEDFFIWTLDLSCTNSSVHASYSGGPPTQQCFFS